MPETLSSRCCIAGGGPAGMMTGFLLARASIDVIVLEKWPDFFHDFRGDTIHPSTMEIMHELDMLDDFLKLPHQKVRQLRGFVGGEELKIAEVPFHRPHSPMGFFELYRGTSEKVCGVPPHDGNRGERPN